MCRRRCYRRIVGWRLIVLSCRPLVSEMYQLFRIRAKKGTGLVLLVGMMAQIHR